MRRRAYPRPAEVPVVAGRIRWVQPRSSASSEHRASSQRKSLSRWNGVLFCGYALQRVAVCDDSFGNDDALRACHSLGYTSLTAAKKISLYGGGTGMIYMDDVWCVESDVYLQNCSYTFSYATRVNTDCTHFEDVGVDCRNVAFHQPVTMVPPAGEHRSKCCGTHGHTNWPAADPAQFLHVVG